MPESEDKVRENIDRLLELAGWRIFDRENADIDAVAGVVLREFSAAGGRADYVMYIDGKCAGIIEAKAAGVSLSGAETQAEKYAAGLPKGVPVWAHPPPFYYICAGEETRFYNGLSPNPRPRNVFAFHTPESLRRRLLAGTENDFLYLAGGMPELSAAGLWKAQAEAVRGLEKSFAAGRRRALIQMATGSGKTHTAINFIYRFIKHAKVRRALFLADRRNLGAQAEREFQNFTAPNQNLKFHEEYGVLRLTGAEPPPESAKVCISTIQRIYAMLTKTELSEEDEERGGDRSAIIGETKSVQYRPELPVDFFDLIVVDECHRSIYRQWRRVLDYFDARIVGLTATPGKTTFAFFEQNLVMEYPHEKAVLDKVNVPFDIYRIRTEVGGRGGKIQAGYAVPEQDRKTRARRWKTLDEDFAYAPEQLDRHVTVPAQIRTVLEAFRDNVFSEIFPGRNEIPKTVVFAKDDNHAETIVQIVREVFARGASFARKITYRTEGADDLINQFRTTYNPRIAVTVDMIATGTDIKPVEIVFFMRAVKSRPYFEQMKGRGVRFISKDDLRAVTPGEVEKDRFVIIDAVGVCDTEKTDSMPMDRKPHIGFGKLMESVAFGDSSPDILSTLAVRFLRLDKKLTPTIREELKEAGADLPAIARRFAESADYDNHFAAAKKSRESRGEPGEPGETEIQKAAEEMCIAAAKIVRNPAVRNAILAAKEKSGIMIDIYTADTVVETKMDDSRAREVAGGFRRYIMENKDEITALQILLSRPQKSQKKRLERKHLDELADKLSMPPNRLNYTSVWTAFMTLQKRPKKAGGVRLLTDLVSLVRLAAGRDSELMPFSEQTERNFDAWLAAQKAAGREFNEEQLVWLRAIRDHIIANLLLETDDLEYAPFAQKGGLGRAGLVFGEDLDIIIAELNERIQRPHLRREFSLNTQIRPMEKCLFHLCRPGVGRACYQAV
ncbi:MAG: DEAD/DEAH box helicase family protein, partial [Betaproteobacteria bacterium]|nr:DEAD/DEAH box helicase family protein [Betaproteobacteria bacterium]